MNTKSVGLLHASDAGCGDVQISFQDLAVVVLYEYNDGSGDRLGRLRFGDAIAFRFRDELHGAGFETSSFDEVVEVSPSAWVDELVGAGPSDRRTMPECRHFAVFLSNNGYLEVVAREATIEASTPGRLSSSQ